MDSDILKEYLVKIGLDMPMSEIQKFNSHMETFDKGIFGLVKRLNNLISGWKAVFLAYSVAAKKIANFTYDVAKADLEIQKWAKHMYLTNDSAKVLSRTLDSMGLQFNDLQDVALNPELYAQYKELVKLGKELTGGKEIEQALRRVREVGFEFTKFRFTLNYLGERIAYYVSKILDTPAGKAFVQGLKDMNNFLKNNIDTIARKIASFLNVIMRTALRISQLISGWFELIKRAYNWIESRIKGLGGIIIGIIGVVGTALLLSPFGQFLLLLQGVMLLLDDYMTYQEGGNYLIPWEKIEGLLESLKDFFTWLFDQMGKFIDAMKYFLDIGEKTPEQEENRVNKLLKPLVVSLPVVRDIKAIKEVFFDDTEKPKEVKQPIVLSFNGSNFTQEDIKRGAMNNNLVQVRFNQGSFVG